LKRELTKVPSLIEVEIAQKRIEQEQLESTLAQLEVELITLHTELNSFETKYLKKAGRYISELDALEAEIAELLSKLNPKIEEYWQYARESKEKAEQSERETRHAEEQPIEKSEFQATEDIKKLFRDVAKRIHPDFASNEEDRSKRSELMRQANQAFENGDVLKLLEILLEADFILAGSVNEDSELDLINKKIARINVRILALRGELSELRNSDLYKLMQEVREAEFRGIDLLQKMFDQLIARIHERKTRWIQLREEYDSQRKPE
jgi:hypothetical protein